jgi:hypothetical protein
VLPTEPGPPVSVRPAASAPATAAFPATPPAAHAGELFRTVALATLTGLLPVAIYCVLSQWVLAGSALADPVALLVAAVCGLGGAGLVAWCNCSASRRLAGLIGSLGQGGGHAPLHSFCFFDRHCLQEALQRFAQDQARTLEWTVSGAVAITSGNGRVELLN